MAKDVLVQQAKDAINDVFSDTSVSLEMTVERLRELREEIDLNLNALREDLRNRPD